MGLGRLERPTSPLSGVRSNHLSYRPNPLISRTTALNGVPITLSGMRKRNEDGAVPPIAGSRLNPVMKGHEDGGNVLWNGEALPTVITTIITLSAASLERR